MVVCCCYAHRTGLPCCPFHYRLRAHTARTTAYVCAVLYRFHTLAAAPRCARLPVPRAFFGTALHALRRTTACITSLVCQDVTDRAIAVVGLYYPPHPTCHALVTLYKRARNRLRCCTYLYYVSFQLRLCVPIIYAPNAFILRRLHSAFQPASCNTFAMPAYGVC